ncbi:MAG: glycoside hydrolase family 32 protein [Lachnospiraceae bacterium]|nr:glycoside hydrolase family 32 protein [Lachnospiraceae bacterium]
MSKLLDKARKYEKEQVEKIPAELRPAFHLTPWVGWMNDPNGFSYHDGYYHMFYQYHPFDVRWNTMHWGHAVSRDLLHWEYRPVALAADETYDEHGCFSGSAVTLDDGRQLLMYTGVHPSAEDPKRDAQHQCVAIGDGVDYEKIPQNPVIRAEDIPEGDDRIDFRDPKILRFSDGTYVVLTVNLSKDGSGQVLMYRSKDCITWEYWKVLASNHNRYGKMWECPDFFEIDGMWYLITSPQFMLAEGYEFISGNGTLWLDGTFDEESGEFTEAGHHRSIDYGIDFYAPQTVLTEDGRRIMIGWMQNWDSTEVRGEEDLPWFGQMTIPRELFVRNGILCQKPTRELDALRHDPVIYEKEVFSGSREFDGIEGQILDLTVELSATDPQQVFEKFSLHFAEKDGQYTALDFCPKDELLTIDRRFSDVRHAGIHQRTALVSGSKAGNLKLRLILDRRSVEVFINDGEKVMSAMIFAHPQAKEISFHVEGEAKVNITGYQLV